MCEFVHEEQQRINDHEKEFHKVMTYTCNVCEKTLKSSAELKEHGNAEHKGPTKTAHSYEVRKRNGFCRFWNHARCTFDKFCKYLHENAPHCRYGVGCRAKPMCQFYHVELSQQQQFQSDQYEDDQFTHQTPQNHFLGRPAHPRSHGWMNGQFH